MANFKEWIKLQEAGTMSSAATGGPGDIAVFKRRLGRIVRRKWPFNLKESELDLDLDLDLDVDKPMQSPNTQRPTQINQPKQSSTQPQRIQNEPPIQSKDTGNMIEVGYPGPNVKGYLHAQQDSKNPKLYRVIRVTVAPQGQGYGKKLYIAAMQIATKKGAMLTSASNSTSDSATHVWNSLYKDPKYKKIPLSPNDWPETPRNNKMMSKYPNLRFKDPNTYPPKNDIEFWSVNSGYQSI
jgi:GNAT superfamily N-acetyltransferase